MVPLIPNGLRKKSSSIYSEGRTWPDGRPIPDCLELQPHEIIQRRKEDRIACGCILLILLVCAVMFILSSPI